MIPLPNHPAISKAVWGAACNGCGLCCAMERCIVADELIGTGPGPCPALENDGQKYRCGMMIHPSKYTGDNPRADEILADIIQRMLGAGKGCGMSDDPANW